MGKPRGVSEICVAREIGTVVVRCVEVYGHFQSRVRCSNASVSMLLFLTWLIPSLALHQGGYPMRERAVTKTVMSEVTE